MVDCLGARLRVLIHCYVQVEGLLGYRAITAPQRDMDGLRISPNGRGGSIFPIQSYTLVKFFLFAI